MSIIGGVLLLLFPPFFVSVFYLLFMIGWWSSRGWEWSLPIIGVLLLLPWLGRISSTMGMDEDVATTVLPVFTGLVIGTAAYRI